MPKVPADEQIEKVRSFNRFYTRHIGLLNEGLLESALSLTEARVLYELAHRGPVTAADLGRELGSGRGLSQPSREKIRCPRFDPTLAVKG
jgi:DNA-binding MarR family transcriptional regulator